MTASAPADGNALSTSGVAVRAFGAVRDHSALSVSVLLLLSILAFPRLAPAEFFAKGLIGGVVLALQAVGVVLVFRSDRIINFAQIQVGVVAGAVFQGIVSFKTPFWLAGKVCEACVPSIIVTNPQDGRVGQLRPSLDVINYIIALLVALLVGVVLSLAIHYGVVRRLREAPRLVLTVATLFVAQILVQLSSTAPSRLASAEQKELMAEAGGLSMPAAPAPFPGGVWVFSRVEMATLIFGCAGLAAVYLYLRWSSTGTAIRAAADNSSRVETLGVNSGSVTARVWLLAGMLSTLAGILLTMSSSGAGGGSAFDASLTVRIFAIALLARFTSIPIAAGVALVVGVVDATAGFAFTTLAPIDASFVVIIVVGLLLQRGRLSRGQLEAASSWQAAREIRPIPSELRPLSVVRAWLRALRFIGAFVLLGLPWIFSTGQIFIATSYMIFGIIGMSLLVLTGWAGQISLGQFAFAAVGAYVVAISSLPFPVALAAAALAGALVAVLVGLPALKLRGLDLAIVTLSFSLTVTALLLNSRYLGRHLPPSMARPRLLGLDLDEPRTFYYFVLVVLVLVVLVVAGLRRSRFGRVLIGARDNERAAQAYGVSLLRTRLTAIAISGALAGFAGALFAYAQFGVKPESFSPDQGVALFLMAVIGGFGAITGPLLGALYMGIVSLFSAAPAVQLLASGGGGLLVLLAAPAGLAGVVSSLRDAALRRVAARARIVVPSLIADIDLDVAKRQRVPVAPKTRPGGGTVFVPTRYGLDRQWAVDELPEERRVPVAASFGVGDDGGSA